MPELNCAPTTLVRAGRTLCLLHLPSDLPCPCSDAPLWQVGKLNDEIRPLPTYESRVVGNDIEVLF